MLNDEGRFAWPGVALAKRFGTYGSSFRVEHSLFIIVVWP